MQLHHSKHHAAYVNNLNATEEKYHEALAKGRYETPALEEPPCGHRFPPAPFPEGGLF